MDIRVNGLTKYFGSTPALSDVSLDVPEGSLTCFLGPSGCGKTTLLRVIAGLEIADSGSIMLGDADLSHTPARDRNFGVVFQSYSLFPNLTAAQNVAYGLECRKWPKAEIRSRVVEMLELVQLSDQRDKLPTQMSGGQQQRIAIARALAPHPSLLLLDEPLSALDAKVREELRQEIRAIQQRLGITTIMVTHDQNEALEMADQIVVLNAGQVEQAGSARALYDRPRTRFVAEFIGSINTFTITAPQTDPHLGTTRLRADKPLTGSTVGIRPEAVKILAEEEEADNVFVATIERATFLGNMTILRAHLETAPDQPIVFEAHGATDGLDPGQTLRLGIAANDIKDLA